jgi:uncharacterized protein (DUF1501 family)
MNHYLADDIRSPNEPSPIRWAPFGANDAFFERHWSKLLVINGIDIATNSHAVGPRHIHSGVLAEGTPAFAALVAGYKRRTSPMAFITNGGYDTTRGVVSATRVGNINAIRRLAQPELLSVNDNIAYHAGNTEDRILTAHRARLQRQKEKVRLPRLKQSLGEVILSRDPNEASLRALTEFLPNLGNLTTGIGRQGALAIAAWRAGICVSANLSTGGFDTHGDHDNRQGQAMTRLTNGLNEIWQLAEEAGVADRITLMVGSDFGRTPGYNEGNGKDHWSVTSMLFMGAGIEGNRVIGSTTPGHRKVMLDPATLEPTGTEEGIVIKPVHIQHALREMTGIDQSQLAAQYPLDGERLPSLRLG